MSKTTVGVIVGALALLASPAQPGPSQRPSLPRSSEAADQWRALRVGLFVHWGVSSGKALPQSHSHARQSELNPSGSVPAAVYDQFYKEFNPTHYDPDALLTLAHDAGIRYAVLVAKHHDAFCMFNTAATDYSIMATPYGKDVAAMFAAACQRRGIALGWQISPKDWKHPDFNTANHDRYNAYHEELIDELSANYGPLAVMWFDGIEPAGPDKWKDTPARVAKMLHERHLGIMLGNHGGSAEDFISFENMVAPFDRRQPWEMCEAINPSGWVHNKPMPPFPLKKLLHNLVYTVARDGNYLLNIGPMADGRLYPPDAQRLGEMAEWMKVNAEGIHGTRGGPYRDGEWGGATCKGSTVYLFLADRVGTTFTLPALAAGIRPRAGSTAARWNGERTRHRYASRSPTASRRNARSSCASSSSSTVPPSRCRSWMDSRISPPPRPSPHRASTTTPRHSSSSTTTATPRGKPTSTTRSTRWILTLASRSSWAACRSPSAASVSTGTTPTTSSSRYAATSGPNGRPSSSTSAHSEARRSSAFLPSTLATSVSSSASCVRSIRSRSPSCACSLHWSLDLLNRRPKYFPA